MPSIVLLRDCPSETTTEAKKRDPDVEKVSSSPPKVARTGDAVMTANATTVIYSGCNMYSGSSMTFAQPNPTFASAPPPGDVNQGLLQALFHFSKQHEKKAATVSDKKGKNDEQKKD